MTNAELRWHQEITDAVISLLIEAVHGNPASAGSARARGIQAAMAGLRREAEDARGSPPSQASALLRKT